MLFLLALSLPAATAWDVVEDGWACASRSRTVSLLSVLEMGDPAAAKSAVAAEIANRRCTVLPRGSVVMSQGGRFNCKGCVLPVVRNQHYLDHASGTMRFRATWYAPARFLWPSGHQR